VSFFDRLFGAPNTAAEPRRGQRSAPGSAPGSALASDPGDARAVERYRYLLQTAPPEMIEKVHTEAFSRLSPAQRTLLFDELARTAPDGEAPADDEPATLARAATRSELRQPGTVERSLARPAFGQVLGASLLGTVAGYVIGSALASAFLPPMDAALADPGTDTGADAAADSGDMTGGDFGDFGDFSF
jgi:hypothetical protein